jgi:hypothetical protein
LLDADGIDNGRPATYGSQTGGTAGEGSGAGRGGTVADNAHRGLALAEGLQLEATVRLEGRRPEVVSRVDALALVDAALVAPLRDPVLQAVEQPVVPAGADGPDVAVGVCGLGSLPPHRPPEIELVAPPGLRDVAALALVPVGGEEIRLGPVLHGP